MINGFVKFIHRLRVLFFFGILFLSLSIVGANPVDLSSFIGASFSDAEMIGSSASVPVNPMNTLALQLQEKESLLDQREADLKELETSIVSRQNKLMWILFSGVGILFVLIIVNFIMDAKRRKEEKTRPSTELGFRY